MGRSKGSKVSQKPGAKTGHNALSHRNQGIGQGSRAPPAIGHQMGIDPSSRNQTIGEGSRAPPAVGHQMGMNPNSRNQGIGQGSQAPPAIGHQRGINPNSRNREFGPSTPHAEGAQTGLNSTGRLNTSNTSNLQTLPARAEEAAKSYNVQGSDLLFTGPLSKREILHPPFFDNKLTRDDCHREPEYYTGCPLAEAALRQNSSANCHRCGAGVNI